MTEQSAQDVLRRVSLFEHVPQAVLSDLARESFLRTFRDGQILCNQDDPGDVLFILESGQVRVSEITRDGREVVFAVQEAPAVLGELSLLDGAPRAATVTAQGPISVRLVPRSAFLALMDTQPSMMRAILRQLTAMIRHTNERHVDVLSLDVPGRLAKWLLTRADRIGEHTESSLVFPMGRTQTDLATELGTTRSTINRALKGFEELGLIEIHDGKVTILEQEELRSYIR